MLCSQCGTQSSEGDAFCNNCGAALPVSAPTVAPPAAAAAAVPPAAAPGTVPIPPATTPQAYASAPPTAPKSHRTLWIVLIIVFVFIFLACGCGAFFLVPWLANNADSVKNDGVVIVDPDTGDDTGDSQNTIATPEDVVDDFYAAAASGDFDEVIVLFSAEAQEFAYPEMFEGWETPSYSIVNVDATNPSYAYVDVQETGGGLTGGLVTYILVTEDGAWKIHDWNVDGVSDGTSSGSGEDGGAPGATILNPESALDAVGTLVNALQNDDLETMRAVSSDYFKSSKPDFFYPSSGALTNFEIVDVFQDGGTYVVIVREEWISGPEEMTYIVIEEAGAAVVDDVIYE